MGALPATPAGQHHARRRRRAGPRRSDAASARRWRAPTASASPGTRSPARRATTSTARRRRATAGSRSASRANSTLVSGTTRSPTRASAPARPTLRRHDRRPPACSRPPRPRRPRRRTASATDPMRINAGGPAVHVRHGREHSAPTRSSPAASTYSIDAVDHRHERPGALPERALGPVHLRDPGRRTARTTCASTSPSSTTGQPCGRLRRQADLRDGRPRTRRRRRTSRTSTSAPRPAPRAALVKTVSGVQVTNGTLSVKSVYGSPTIPRSRRSRSSRRPAARARRPSRRRRPRAASTGVAPPSVPDGHVLARHGRGDDHDGRASRSAARRRQPGRGDGRLRRRRR